MNIYTRRIVASSVSGEGGLDLLYTVPSNAAVIVRDIVLMTTQPGQVQLQVAAASGGAYQLLWENPTEETFLHLELRQALEPGDTISAYHSDAYASNIAITAYVFVPF